MIQFFKEHKMLIAILCAATLLCLLLTIYFSLQARPLEQMSLPTGNIHDSGVFDEKIVIHDSSEGEITIGVATAGIVELEPLPIPLKTVPNTEDIWSADTYAGNHTPAEKAQMKDGSLGALNIPALKLSVNVYESPDNMEAMSKGVAHFPSTSAFDGNVGLSAHNINLDGSDGYFKYLYTLQAGDIVTYKTAIGERSYQVESITTIVASDWSLLSYTDDNRLTMITCISGQPDKRLCVTAIEKI